MSNAVYTFGPGAHPSSALALCDALTETFPTYNFSIEMVSAMAGVREGVVLQKAPSNTVWQVMVSFARGFVAGFGHTFPAPKRADLLQHRLTKTDCPAAKKKSDPPPSSKPTLPSQRAYQIGSLRYPTLTGVAPQSRRV